MDGKFKKRTSGEEIMGYKKTRSRQAVCLLPEKAFCNIERAINAYFFSLILAALPDLPRK